MLKAAKVDSAFHGLSDCSNLLGQHSSLNQENSRCVCLVSMLKEVPEATDFDYLLDPAEEVTRQERNTSLLALIHADQPATVWYKDHREGRRDINLLFRFSHFFTLHTYTPLFSPLPVSYLFSTKPDCFLDNTLVQSITAKTSSLLYSPRTPRTTRHCTRKNTTESQPWVCFGQDSSAAATLARAYTLIAMESVAGRGGFRWADTAASGVDE
ncbi:hypothetical protein J3F83DRAFT_749514 [Trichoderma novae-zelandiae]